ncbi:fused MFS/spermidine synthase [Allosphingosinicella indica]|uniref:Spermidine synthase n=1 Tax=Allosphingosinicella indica TaxID=941907 RepID=A0A1X7GKE4_9SPHN|nr:fused MFS/spermidine synthase [Allosphingosinicella indica]SMF71150.1 hypothetical protein SAMN06295910_1981 [Allosphingosinicella indica]
MSDIEQALPRSDRRERLAKPLFVATIVAGSFLLFLMQPMIARMALPRLGGAPAVWNSAMLVYQALLLAGYAYAHWLSRLKPRRQAGLHLALFGLAALWLPIGISSALPPADGNPILWVPWFLLSSIGPLFFIVSAQAPLMQRWYALESSRGEPYALYAASNLGSFAGLFSYPLLVEPFLTLDQQSLLWTAGYGVLVLLVVGCALTTPSHLVETKPEAETPRPRPKEVAYWVALAAVPSGLMLSTTTHLTTDIVAMPLLWALPLGLYLLSFVVAFATRRGVADFITQLAPLLMLIAGGLAFASGSRSPVFSATLGLSLLFVVAVTLHAEMYRRRPAADHLTAFYLAMSLGGVIGGAFCAILAPVVFDWAYEHPLLIVAAAFLLPQWPLIPPLRRLWSDPFWRRALTIAIPVIVLPLSALADGAIIYPLPEWVAIGGSILIAILGVVSIGRKPVFAICLGALMLSYGGWLTLRLSAEDTRTRSYFGIYQVIERHDEAIRTLMHGTTLHGVQNLAPGKERSPTSYYGPNSGVGRAMLAAPALYGPGARIGVVGLGTGTLACYAQPAERWTFFEIDPAMVRIATDPARFTFLRRCAPEARIELGDARLMLERAPPASYDLLAVDAFSSDAVPMHLLTREAIRSYGRALAPNGLLLIHISNRYLNLEPVLAQAADAEGWDAWLIHNSPTPAEQTDHLTTSIWVALSRDPAITETLVDGNDPNDRFDWRELERRPGFTGWSDDFASILPLLKDVRPW